VKNRKFPFPDISHEKEIFNSDFPIFHGKGRRPFPDLKFPSAAKDCNSPFPDISREKDIFDSDFPVFHGKMKRPCPDLKSPFAAKGCKSSSADISPQKEIFKIDIEIIDVQVWIFLGRLQQTRGSEASY